MIQFEIGKTYICRSICDHDCIFSFDVIARSAKRITIKDALRGVRRVGVQVYGGEEFCRPLGRYSMAPILRAGEAVV